MGYEVKMGEDGVLYSRLSGYMSDEEAAEYKQMCLQYLEQATGTVSTFVDCREIKKMSSQARRVMAELNDHPNAGRVGVVGVGPYVAALTTFINKLIGKTDLRFFRDQEEALAYVRGEDL